MVELYYGDQLGAMVLLHHYVQQLTLVHEASQVSSKLEILQLCMLVNSLGKVDC